MDEDRTGFEAATWLYTIIIVCFYLAAFSVLDSVVGLFYYWAFLAGKVDPVLYPKMYSIFQEVQQSPYPYLAMNFYNIVLWNGVIVCSIWLFRYHKWARIALCRLLELDIIVTVLDRIWKTYQGKGNLDSPWIYIIFNCLQVGAIIALAHPKIVEVTEQLSLRKKQSASLLKKNDIQ